MLEEIAIKTLFILFSLIILFFFALISKYYYISAICREWNAKLYKYQKHLISQKDLDENDKNYKYLSEMYLYPDEIGIHLFRDWSESDLIMDKLTLHNVNEVNEYLEQTQGC
jgi:hypothetical protein